MGETDVQEFGSNLYVREGQPPPTQTPPRGAGFLWIFFSQGKVGQGRTYVKWQCWHCCSWDLFSEPKLRCDCTIMQPAAAFSSKPSFAAADQCGFERSFGPPQSKNHLIHVSFLPALEPHLRMNSARFWQLNSWVPLQRDVLYEGRIRGTSEQISCYQALDDCVYFFAQPGRHTKKSIAAVPEP